MAGTWPGTLPSPKTSGYQLSPADQTVRTDMEVGYPRQRRRTADRNDQVTVEWLFTDVQMDTFRTWFDGTTATDAQGGAAWFTISLYIGETGATSVSARFVGPFQARFMGGCDDRWMVSARLEVDQ